MTSVNNWQGASQKEILPAMAGSGATARTLFGRGEDLAALEGAFEQARGGEPVTVLVGGEAGIGKTLLVSEWAERVFAGGARVLRGACVDLQDTPVPYAAMIDALRSVPADAFEQLGPTLRAELGALVPEAAPEEPATAGPTQAGLFGAVLRLIEQLGRESPLVLVVEDVHWADRSTQDMLRFLVRGLRQTAVLIVLTYRSPEMHREPADRELLADLRRAPGVVSIELAPLSAADTAKQLAELAAGPVHAGTARAIHARSEGNPFFSGELLAAGTAAMSLPGGLRDVLVARLDRLPADGRAVARVAACVGRDVDDELLLAVGDLDRAVLNDSLRACVAAQVLEVSHDRRGYRFRHALLQEVCASELLPGEDADLHERIADLLEQRIADGGKPATAQQLAEIAHHRLRTADRGAGLRAAAQAAQASESIAAWAEASTLYESVIERWDDVADAERLAGFDLAFALDRAGECLFLGTGDVTSASRRVEQALAALTEDDHNLRRAEYTSRLATLSWHAHASVDASLPLLEQAMALLDGTPSPVAAQVQARYAGTLMMAGHLAEAEVEAVEAARVARACDAGVPEADALITHFICRGEAGDQVRALELIEEAGRPVHASRDPTIVRRYFTNAVYVLSGFALYAEALDVAQQGIDLHEQAGLTDERQACLHHNAAGVLCALGRPADAADTLGDRKGAFASDRAAVHLAFADIRLLQGALDESAAEVEALRAIPDLTSAFLSAGLVTLAEVELWRSGPGAAQPVIAHAQSLSNPEERLARAQLASLALRSLADDSPVDVDESQPAADVLLAELRSAADGGDGRLPEVDARLLTGIAEATRLTSSDPEAWQRASDAWRAIGRRYDLAYTRWREAEALAGARDRREALEQTLADAHADCEHRRCRAHQSLQSGDSLAVRG